MPAPQWMHSGWAAVGALVLVLGLAFGSAGVRYLMVRGERGGEPPTVTGISAADVQDYTAKLKQKVPCEPSKFAAAGMKAVHYVPHEHYSDLFEQVTVTIEPVKLLDRVTGKTERYTKARLTLCQLDPPTARTGDLRGYANRAYTSAANPPSWVIVEMLP